jgi:hypothetical protein
MHMRICYLDCHEAGLGCYLLIHVENLLRPLHLFYFCDLFTDSPSYNDELRNAWSFTSIPIYFFIEWYFHYVQGQFYIF